MLFIDLDKTIIEDAEIFIKIHNKKIAYIEWFENAVLIIFE